jgi:hypothetical protein
MSKRMSRLLSGIVLAGTMVGTVQAGTIASGPVYGGPRQGQVACTVVNVSSARVNFTRTQLLGQFVAPLPLNFNDCGASLEPNETCSFQAAAGNQATSCKVSILEANTTIRATLLALSLTNENLSEAALR